jgi:hypothetical protein
MQRVILVMVASSQSESRQYPVRRKRGQPRQVLPVGARWQPVELSAATGCQSRGLKFKHQAPASNSMLLGYAPTSLQETIDEFTHFGFSILNLSVFSVLSVAELPFPA